MVFKKITNKFIVVLCLGILLVGVVLGNLMTREGNGPYIVEVKLEEGWNLIAGTFLDDNSILEDSQIQEEDIKVMWYYSSIQKKYFQIHPITEETWSTISQDDEDFVFTSAMWIYSERKGKMKYSTLEDYPLLDQRKLYSGWNFVTITPDMMDKSLGGMKGSCEIEKAYLWDSKDQEWYLNQPLPLDEEFYEGAAYGKQGEGFVIKVSSDCNLGATSSSDVVGVPSLPEEDAVNTGLRKDIEDAYYEEFAYETCELNPYENSGFISETECKSAILCLAEKFASIVPEEDLESLAINMEESGGESGYINYLNNNPDLEDQIEPAHTSACLPSNN